ncbi:MAG: hypothetical protein ACJ786_08385, partial [Catenulispora sp.]
DGPEDKKDDKKDDEKKDDKKDGDKKDELDITPSDLKQWAKDIRTWTPPLRDVQLHLEKVKIKAGNFKDGFDLANTGGYGTDQGRAKKYATLSAKLHDALTTLADKLDTLSVKYATTEEFAKNAGTDLGDIEDAVNKKLGGPNG